MCRSEMKRQMWLWKPHNFYQDIQENKSQSQVK